MLAPGSKGWILKYFALVQQGEISLYKKNFLANPQYFKHLTFSKTGINLGFPSEFIFSQPIDVQKWTNNEQLKYLFFECHLSVYIDNAPEGIATFDSQKFITTLLDFYEHHSALSITKIFTFYLKESNDEKLEKILDKRTDVKKNLLDNAIWVNYLSNAFIYLDVILFDEFLRTQRTLGDSNYDTYAENALYALSLAAYADGKIDPAEKQLLQVFLASANLRERKKHEIEKQFSSNATLQLIQKSTFDNELFRYFLLDISALTIYATHDATRLDEKFLKQLCVYLNLPIERLNETRIMVENFVLRHNDKIAFLSNANAVEQLYDNLSKRWVKILGRNKDKLVIELNQSKELVSLIKKSTKEELSKEEKEKVKMQFLDLIKSMPAFAIFMLPGGVILLPLVLKIIPTLIPSAFRDNEIEK